jgi:hypothetical protein
MFSVPQNLGPASFSRSNINPQQLQLQTSSRSEKISNNVDPTPFSPSNTPQPLQSKTSAISEKKCSEIVHVILRIDNFLGCSGAYIKKLEEIYFFKINGAIFLGEKTYYIFPGSKEFLKTLFKTENFKISFFMSASREKCKGIVDFLLKSSLDEAEYDKIKDSIGILGCEDLKILPWEQSQNIKSKYSLTVSNELNIQKILEAGELIENVVFVDNYPKFLTNSCISIGSISNILQVPSCNEVDSRSESFKESLHSGVYKFLRCVLATEESRNEIEAVKMGRQILILKKESNFEICFIDFESKEYRRELISSENSSLIAKLAPLCTVKNETHLKIRNQKLIQSIYDLVTARNGKTMKIFRKQNRIFYAAGLLFTALRESKAQKISISEALFQRQFKPKRRSLTFNNQLKYDDELYLLGLKYLREVNENLELRSADDSSQHFVYISDEERAKLEQALKNQENCCIL